MPSSFEALINNPLFFGGMGLAVVGTAAAAARKSVIRMRKRFLVDLELNHTDEAYKWFLHWMARQYQQSLATPPKTLFDRLSKEITRVHHFSMRTTVARAPDGGIGHVHFVMEPGYGKHIMRYRDAFIAINRERKGTASQSGQQFETLRLTTLFRYGHVLQYMFQEAHQQAAAAQVGKTKIYTPRYADWVPFGEPIAKRALSTINLDEGVKESIISDIQRFMSKQELYTERGIPYRRGYLLYGPPGTGKTSLIKALAGELDYGIALISLSQRGLTDDALNSLLTKVPDRTIVLLEDADAAFNKRRKTEEDGYNGAHVTFSGLLNALDGIATGGQRIAFLTTNHIDKLDDALIRPGRVDKMVRIGEATRYQAGSMWDRFYGHLDVDGKGRERFLEKLEELGLIAKEGSREGAKFRTSAAAIQGLFLCNDDDMEGAISMAEGLIPRVYEPETPMASAA